MTYKPEEWDLSDISPEDLDRVLIEVERRTADIEKRRPLSGDISQDDFMRLVKDLEAISIISSKLGAYASLRVEADSSDQEALALRSKLNSIFTKKANRLLFISLWFKDLPEEKAKELIKTSGKYHYHFEEIRRTKPYTLKENEEQIINIKDITGASALNNIYDILTSQFEYDLEGKKVSQQDLIVLVRDPSPEKRKAAYLSLLTKYKEHKDVLGEIYKNIVNDWREESIGLRKYKSPINVRNVANDIPDEAVDALLKVAEKNQHIFHKFFEIKRKKLGLKKLRRFDIYAPVEEEEKKVDYDRAVNMVLEAYEEFSPVFREHASAILDKKHVHSRLQKNKHTGAFCYCGTTKVDPFILLNFAGTLRDVSTLAHELGHGVHDILAKDQTEFTFHPSLPMAETASIFGEMLLSEKLKKEDPEAAKALAFSKVDDLYASIIRQAGFVTFEKKAHKMMEEGKTFDELNRVYLNDIKAQLGPDIEVDSIFQHEWNYIPHIYHTPFYCYAYAFGNLLVLALWEMYKKDNKFSGRIIEMLSKGGSESPAQMTEAIGIDIKDEGFWQQGFDVIEKMIGELEP